MAESGHYQDDNLGGGSFQMTEATRAVLGPQMVSFIEQKVLLRKDVLLVSSADCDDDKKPSAELKGLFGLASKLTAMEQENKMCEHARSGGPSVVPLEGRDGSFDSFISYTNAEHLTERLSKIGEGFKGNISQRDATVFSVLHEIFHENDIYTNKQAMLDPDDHDAQDGFNEVRGDGGARAAIAEAYRAGLVSNPNVPDIIRGARAVASMVAPNEKYFATSLVAVPGIDLSTPEKVLGVNKDIGRARDKIMHEIGKDLVPKTLAADSHSYALRSLIFNSPDQFPKGLKEDISIRTARPDGFDYEKHDKEVERRLANMKPPGALKEEYERLKAVNVRETIAAAAEREVKNNPSLLYETTRKMALQGAFDADPIQKAFAKEFVRAAETYAGEYFKTDGKQTFAADVKTAPWRPRPAEAANSAQFGVGA